MRLSLKASRPVCLRLRAAVMGPHFRDWLLLLLLHALHWPLWVPRLDNGRDEVSPGSASLSSIYSKRQVSPVQAEVSRIWQAVLDNDVQMHVIVLGPPASKSSKPPAKIFEWLESTHL